MVEIFWLRPSQTLPIPLVCIEIQQAIHIADENKNMIKFDYPYWKGRLDKEKKNEELTLRVHKKKRNKKERDIGLLEKIS